MLRIKLKKVSELFFRLLCYSTTFYAFANIAVNTNQRSFILASIYTTRCVALKQSVIFLCVEKPLFIKSDFLKAMVYVCCDNKMVLTLYKPQKLVIYRFRSVHITIHIDMFAHTCWQLKAH